MKHWQSDVIVKEPTKAKEPHGCFQQFVIVAIVGLMFGFCVVGVLAALGRTL